MKSVVGLEAALVKPPTEYPGNFFEGTRFATECFIYFQPDFSNLFSFCWGGIIAPFETSWNSDLN